MDVRSVFIRVNVLSKQNYDVRNIPPQRGEVVGSRQGNHFYRAVAFWKDEVSDDVGRNTRRFSYTSFVLEPLLACFTTEQNTFKASLFVEKKKNFS